MGEFRAVGAGGDRVVSEVKERGARKAEAQDVIIRTDPIVKMWVISEGTSVLKLKICCSSIRCSSGSSICNASATIDAMPTIVDFPLIIYELDRNFQSQ